MRATEGIEVGDGYAVAARVTVGFDGGYHEIRGDLLRCRACGSLLRPADQEIHGRHHARLDLLGAAIGLPPESAGVAPGPAES